MDKVHQLVGTGGRFSIAAGLLLVMLVPSGGCRICAQCDDLDYPAYGGAWQRTRRDGGRVGSVFDPAGAKTAELVPREAPEKPDERQRQQRSESQSDDPSMQDQYEADRDRQVDPDRLDLQEKMDQLRNKELEDIKEDREQELRNRTPDDIDVRVIPGEPVPPALR